MLTARRLGITALLAAAIFAFAYSFTIGADDQPVGVSGSPVELLLPPPGAQVLRQSTIEADLAVGWTGVLIIEGTEVPADQLNCISDCDLALCDISSGAAVTGQRSCRDPSNPQGRIFYVPDDGKEIEELPTGETCVTAVIWRVAESRDNSQRVPWCFRVTA